MMIHIEQSASIVVHGGAGAAHHNSDGCAVATRCALDVLAGGGNAYAAAIAAVVAMEDDDRFNAGTGSVLCLDGHTIEMDAAVMDNRGKLGAVACIQHVKNPVLVARDVAESPHRMLAGDGATRFAHARGHAEYYNPTAKALEKHRKLRVLIDREPSPYGELWNYPHPLHEEDACDTVGAVVRGADGHFAVAASTGGSAPSLLGRVGDTPMIGSGFFAGPAGAVTVTGVGEAIVPHLLAHSVYQWLDGPGSLAAALQRGLGLFDGSVAIGIVAVTPSEAGCASNREMPFSFG